MIADREIILDTNSWNLYDSSGGHDPIWGSAEWNATNDPQHAADIAWLHSQAYADFLNSRGSLEGGHYVLGAGGDVVWQDAPHEHWYQNPGIQLIAILVGGVAAGGAGAATGIEETGAAAIAEETVVPITIPEIIAPEVGLPEVGLPELIPPVTEIAPPVEIVSPVTIPEITPIAETLPEIAPIAETTLPEVIAPSATPVADAIGGAKTIAGTVGSVTSAVGAIEHIINPPSPPVHSVPSVQPMQSQSATDESAAIPVLGLLGLMLFNKV